MPDPTSTLTSEPPSEALVYRPISGLAIASMTLACLYVVLVFLSAVIGVIKGEPFFLPTWLLGLPIAAFILSALALRHIRNSEDTRAGIPLAKWGLWLSVVSGLGYLTFSFFTRLAVTDQAHRFLMEKGAESGFFPLLQSGDETDRLAAFLLTLPVAERRGMKPELSKLDRFDTPMSPESGRGKLSAFLESPLVRLFQQDKNALVEASGLKDWDYKDKGYKVERNYRISSAEGVYDVLLTMRSADGEAGEGRKWSILWQQDPITAVKLTPLGKKMLDLRREAFDFAALWVEKHKRGPREAREAYYDTRLAGERSQLRQRFETRKKQAPALDALSAWLFAAQSPTSLGGSVPVYVAPHGFSPTVDEAAEFVLPDYDDFVRGSSYLKLDRFRGEAKLENAARPMTVALFHARSVVPPDVKLRPVTRDFSLWSIPKPGELEIQLEFEMRLPLKLAGSASVGAQVVGKVVVSILEPADPAGRDIQQQFRLARIECERVVTLPAPSPGPGDR